MHTEQLRAPNRGEKGVEDVATLTPSQRSINQNIDDALDVLLRYSVHHPEGMIPASLIPIVATN